MNAKIRLMAFSVVLAFPAIACASSKAASPFVKGERVTMLGDSITHGGKYCANLQLFWDLRFPGSGVRLMNCGVSGGTAGGGLDRWDRDVLKQNADRIFVMFGMNDVGGRDFDGKVGLAAAAQYTTNMARIVEQTLAAGKRMTIITPTPYDEYGTNYTAKVVAGRDSVGLSRLAQICRDLADRKNVELLELYGPLSDFVKKRPEFSFCRADRVHPTADGHIIMTAEFLSQLGISPYVAQVEIDAASAKVVKSEDAVVSNLTAAKNMVSFAYSPKHLPFPVTPEYTRAAQAYPVTEKMNIELLKVKALPKGCYSVSVDNKELARFSDGELTAGVNLALLKTPGAALAAEAWDFSRKLSTVQLRLRTLVQMESLAKRKGADLSKSEGAVAKMEEYVEGLRKSGSSYYKYYSNQLACYKRDKACEEALRNQEDYWRRKLAVAAGKKWSGQVTISRVGK